MQAQSADHADFPGLYACSLLVGDDRMIFPEIDVKQTALNVQTFFNDTVPRILNLAGRSINDLTKPEEWQKHYQEESTGNEYEQAVDALIEAIGIMRDGDVYHYHRTLLIDCYIKRKNNLDEEIKLGLGERTVNKYRQQACAEFAECFEGVKARRGLKIDSMLVETCGECAV